MKSGYMMKAALLSLVVSAAISTQSAVAADGEKLYTEKLCATCHGDEGKAPIMNLYPKVNGQSKEYTIAQIKMIKDGTRAGGLTIAMKAMIATLSDEDITAIAEYLSSVE
jgi:cytochrome c553